MKILVLNPHFGPGHSALRLLQSKGFAVLHPADATEAIQMLQIHGTSVNLAVIHRENATGSGQPGIDLITRMKLDPAQSDLPFVLTTEKWGDADCAENQSTPDGANAYLKFPFSDEALVQLVEAVMGQTPTVSEAPAPMQVESPPEVSGPVLATESPFELEDASALFQIPASPVGGITLEAHLSEAAPSSPSLPSGSESIPDFDLSLALDISPEHLESVSAPVKESAFDASALESVAAAPAPDATPDATNEYDEEVAVQMPYLSESPHPGAASSISQFLFTQPVGDAVVPGGAVHSPDLETLKKYLLLREQDVAALSGQLRSSREQVRSIEENLRAEKARNIELGHVYEGQKKKIDNFDREKMVAYEAAQQELSELRFQTKARTDKARVLEVQVREAAEEMDRLKDRVRMDIRKIRVREKDLENRLEIMKKDSEALLGARENKIIELKRKLDLLEFNMDLLQDQYSREKQNSVSLRERLVKAAQVVRVAGGLLGSTSSLATASSGASSEEAPSEDELAIDKAAS